MQLLGIETMQHAHGALRHGALFDMLDREHDQTDVRSSSVERLAAKFSADPQQAERVARTAQHLLQQLLPSLKPAKRAVLERELAWVARLHEIGARISHADYHKHGAYILDNADVPGFAMHELHKLSQLVLGHRGKLRKLELQFDDRLFMAQLAALRLAVLLSHARQAPAFEALQAATDAEPQHGFSVTVPAGWAKAWPQSAHLLAEEVLAWQRTPWGLRVTGLDA